MASAITGWYPSKWRLAGRSWLYGDDVSDDDADPTTSAYRVTVRGRFHELDERARRWLRAHRTEHDIFVSAFTSEGTLTYDDRLDFFNLRYEVRLTGGDATPQRAVETAEAEAGAFLGTLRLGYRDLHSDVMDLRAMTERRRAAQGR